MPSLTNTQHVQEVLSELGNTHHVRCNSSEYRYNPMLQMYTMQKLICTSATIE